MLPEVSSTMAATTQRQQPPTATVTTLSSEEEALKRNTDCVYFLASPLTCKKGSECEYRHSEYARVNPRDCYYWLNGNCLNPKCGFRHPPLDSLFGSQAAAPVGSSLPPPQTVAAPATHTPYNSAKHAVPCIFFQKGLCLKGDRCAFSHGPNTSGNKVSETNAAASSSEVQIKGKGFGGRQKFTQEKNILSKAVDLPLEAKTASTAGVAPPRTNMDVERNSLQPNLADDEVPRYKAMITQIVHGNPSRSNRLHSSDVADDQSFQNGKDYDDLLRESSPGFDVLVDDELRDSDYYHGEDPEGRNLNSVDEYELGQTDDYGPMSNIDQETYHGPRGYDSFDHMQGQDAWGKNRASSERMLGAPAHLKRRGYGKAHSPEQIDESDLRYRLSKFRRVSNGLRSVVSHDTVSIDHVEERGFRVSSRRDSHVSPRESSIRSRLQGRIKLPGRSLNNGGDEVEKGRNWGVLSPGGSQLSSHQGRLRDRINSRVEEDYNNEGRNFRCPQLRREIMDQKSIDFAGPKSLAELKVSKHPDGRTQKFLGKRKHLEDFVPSEGDLSFEGPMPLSEILKRKKEAEAAASAGKAISANKHSNKQSEREEDLTSCLNNDADVKNHSGFLLGAKDGDKSQGDKGESAAERMEVFHNQSSQLPNLNELGSGDERAVDNLTEDPDYNGDDQRDGDYEYEQDEGDYNYDEEGENVDAEEGENANVDGEDVDDEEADDFAKKIGVMFS
ncbi:hypothetical protein K2173_009088 [Erythroxylum novogranatense]|uniref:C3H1-type domain-containing protein n=1 Tax=Erythroxylum novogranatense TaxID=1862640 RepID=A0AAV8TSS4_9ROSI|nr:hypothetical protein K2173_009088 [Erythroxylum novogranatense]